MYSPGLTINVLPVFVCNEDNGSAESGCDLGRHFLEGASLTNLSGAPTSEVSVQSLRTYITNATLPVLAIPHSLEAPRSILPVQPTLTEVYCFRYPDRPPPFPSVAANPRSCIDGIQAMNNNFHINKGAKLFLGGLRYELVSGGKSMIAWLVRCLSDGAVSLPESFITVHSKRKVGPEGKPTSVPTGCVSIFIDNLIDADALMALHRRAFCGPEGLYIAPTATIMEELIHSGKLGGAHCDPLAPAHKGPAHPIVIERAVGRNGNRDDRPVQIERRLSLSINSGATPSTPEGKHHQKAVVPIQATNNNSPPSLFQGLDHTNSPHSICPSAIYNMSGPTRIPHELARHQQPSPIGRPNQLPYPMLLSGSFSSLATAQNDSGHMPINRPHGVVPVLSINHSDFQQRPYTPGGLGAIQMIGPQRSPLEYYTQSYSAAHRSNVPTPNALPQPALGISEGDYSSHMVEPSLTEFASSMAGEMYYTPPLQVYGDFNPRLDQLSPMHDAFSMPNRHFFDPYLPQPSAMATPVPPLAQPNQYRCHTPMTLQMQVAYHQRRLLELNQLQSGHYSQ